SHLAHQAASKLEICILIEALYLHIDGCGKPEVKNLRNDISLGKPELNASKLLRHLVPDRSYELVSGTMILFERDDDIAVCGAGGSTCVIGSINAAIGNTQIIDDTVELTSGDYLPQHAFDLIRCARGFFDAGPSLHPDVHIEPPGIDAGEEVF